MPYPLQIQKSNKRKTISICVYPDASVKIYVPSGTTQSRINEVIKLKERWIINKVEKFKNSKAFSIQKKEYISGENFYYLGKQYKLSIVDGRMTKLEIDEDTILLYRTSKSANIKNILTRWFLYQAQEVFEKRLRVNFEIFSKHYKYPLPTLKLRKMKARWGSMSNQGKMTLNAYLIHTPLECIDYVIMHELCHLKHKNHSDRFYNLQSEFMPQYKDLRMVLKDFTKEIRSM